MINTNETAGAVLTAVILGSLMMLTILVTPIAIAGIAGYVGYRLF